MQINSKRYRTGIMLLAVLPQSAFALDLDFYTYNGFTEIVNAFQRIALIFNDQEYVYLIFIAAVFGLMYGGISFYTKQMIGGFQSQEFNLSWLIGIMIGVIVYKGLVLPKGTLHIYDPVRNDYQAVGHIPDLIIVAAGILNKVERVTVEIVDANSAYPYKNEAGGIGFELLYNVTADYEGIDDYYLVKSLKQYYKDCSPIALSQSAYNFDLNQLRSGTNNLLTLLGNLRSPAEFTTYYTAASKSGTTLSCTDAYNNGLFPLLNSSANFTAALRSVCAKSGFNVASAPQLQRCQDALARMNTTVFNVTANHIHTLRNTVIANAIANALMDENPDMGVRALSNRAMMTEGLGTAIAAQDWLPTIRASMLTIILGLMPILVVLLVTPVWSKSLFLLFGLFLWMTLWGVCDVIMHGIAMDQAIAATDEVKRHNMGISAMMLAPEASMKALAIFGKARSQGVMLATALSSILFGLSAYAFSQISGHWSSQVDNKGQESGERAQTPEGADQSLRGLASANSTAFNMGMTGFQRYSNATTFNQGSDIQRADAVLEGSGMSMGSTIQSQGALEGGAQLGALQQTQQVGKDLGFGSNAAGVGRTSQKISALEQQKRMGHTLGSSQAAETRGQSNFGMSYNNALIETLQHSSANDRLEVVKDRLGDVIEQKSGVRPADRDLYNRLADYDLAAKQGDIGATTGDANRMAEFNERNRSMQITEMSALTSMGKNFGMNIQDIAQADGKFRAIHGAANEDTLEKMTPEEVAMGYFVGQVRQGTDGMAIQNLASGYEGGTKQYLADIARYQTANDFGRMVSFSHAAEALGKEFPAMGVAMNSSGLTMAVTGADVPRLLEEGMIDTKTADLISRDGGGTLTATFDPTNGFSLTTSTRTGNSAHADRSFRDDSSETTTSAKVLDNRVAVESGVQIGSNTASTLLMEPKEKALLADVLRTVDGNQAGEENFTLAAASWLNQITSSHATENFISERSLSGFLSGQGSAERGFGLGRLGGVLGGKMGLGITGTDTDSDSHSISYGIVNDLFARTERTAEQMAHKTVNQEAAQEGQSMTLVEREARFEELKYEAWAEQLMTGFQNTVEHYKDTNLSFTRDSEMAKDIQSKTEQ